MIKFLRPSLTGSICPLKHHACSSSSSSYLKRSRCTRCSVDGNGDGLAMWESVAASYVVKVARAEGRRLDVGLVAPFTIATTRLEKVQNVAMRVELEGGSVGWGEAPILPHVTAEDQPLALHTANYASHVLQSLAAQPLLTVLQHINALLPGHAFASVRAGMEMAVIDAVAHALDLPLWQLFGGATRSLTTDITIPIVSPTEAAELAGKYCQQGFGTLKLKVGKKVKEDIKTLKAIRKAHPKCSFILDCNEGYSATEALEVLRQLHEIGVAPILLEQPVARDDWDGLGHVSKIAREVYGVSVAADESCRGFLDVQKIIQEGLADVINIKLAKVGVLGALEIIRLSRKEGLVLMIGGMVETRLAMGFAGHLAAGLGCFKFVDLDTPLLLSEDPVIGGYQVAGPVYRFTDAAGHGGFLEWKELKEDTEPVSF